MKDRKKPEKFLLPHGMPSDARELAFSSRVPPKALKIKAPYKSWHYQLRVMSPSDALYTVEEGAAHYRTPGTGAVRGAAHRAPTPDDSRIRAAICAASRH